jgi:23S rRNA (pseudouridine1915-N3)-methyltransferase
VVFLIGGSWGLDQSARERANAILSFGKMTFPHALARVMLLEQLYRAAMIQSGKTYHK